MPIKIIKNRGINIKRQLLSIKLSINVNSKKGFVFAQKNAACCIKWARQKEIEDKIILVCILKQRAASYMQKQNMIKDFCIFM